jgi:hypothetical protein
MVHFMVALLATAEDQELLIMKQRAISVNSKRAHKSTCKRASEHCASTLEALTDGKICTAVAETVQISCYDCARVLTSGMNICRIGAHVDERIK